jgi:hypothetical protein
MANSLPAISRTLTLSRLESTNSQRTSHLESSTKDLYIQDDTFDDSDSARQLKAPKMSRKLMSMPEALKRGADLLQSRRPPISSVPPCLPSLQGVMPSEQHGGSGPSRPRVGSKPFAPSASGAECGKDGQSGCRLPELERRKEVHPRLRFPRLRYSEVANRRDQDDTSKMQTTGIVSSDAAVQGRNSVDNDIEQVLQDCRRFGLPTDWYKQTPAAAIPVQAAPSGGGAADSDVKGCKLVLPRKSPRRLIVAGGATTVCLPTADTSPRIGKVNNSGGNVPAKDRKYLLRQAPLSHIVGADLPSAPRSLSPVKENATHAKK